MQEGYMFSPVVFDTNDEGYFPISHEDDLIPAPTKIVLYRTLKSAKKAAFEKLWQDIERDDGTDSDLWYLMNGQDDSPKELAEEICGMLKHLGLWDEFTAWAKANSESPALLLYNWLADASSSSCMYGYNVDIDKQLLMIPRNIADEIVKVCVNHVTTFNKVSVVGEGDGE